MKKLNVITLILLVLAMAACSVRAQRVAIKDARFGLLAVGQTIDTLDQIADETWGSKPMEDTEAYCAGMKAALVLEQMLHLVYAGADAVFVWELSVEKWAQTKGGPHEDVAWSEVLSSQVDWYQLSVHIIGMLDQLRVFFEELGLKLPPSVMKVWGALPWVSGSATVPAAWDWSSLKDSVCADQ